MRILFSLSLILFFSTGLFSQDLKKLIDKGDLAAIQKIEAKGFDILQSITIQVDYYDGDYDYLDIDPIVYASGKQQIEIVNYYITKKEQIDEYSSWENALANAFISSISTKNDELIELLYAENPNLSITCDACRSHNAIMVAATYGNEKWYFKLKEKSDLNLLSNTGNNLLHLAVAGGSRAIIEDVVKSGNFDVNQKNSLFLSPIDYAILDSNLVTFNYLLEHGADVRLSGNAWKSVVQTGHLGIFQVLVDSCDPGDLFIYDDHLEWPLNMAVAYNDETMALEIARLMKTHILEGKISGLEYEPLIEYEKYHILTNAIFWKNEKTFEAILDLAHTINKVYEDPQTVMFEEYLFKRAQRTFGKSFMTEMQEKYAIEWY
ncbi:MAG: hypothetical protein IPO32_19045 [Crocinitomicaceae bacterium]|nr:hypothetical protein [Crocinitomicaceae bacterium]